MHNNRAPKLFLFVQVVSYFVVDYVEVFLFERDVEIVPVHRVFGNLIFHCKLIL